MKATLFFMTIVALYIPLKAEHIIILHTNDTHSTIEPLEDGTGGILQRKVIIDSIRSAEKNVITVDAGDAVQGTLYFKYFKGDVEYPLMNMVGYDIRVLGNHEFDNGMAELAERYKDVQGLPLSTNYDFTGTELENVFLPYAIVEKGGKKIGFIGINIDPSSIISKKNINVDFKEVIPTANRYASMLKNELGCDLVIAVTHIGYVKSNDKTTDVELAQNSEDIDIIIGGHSHTLIDPSDNTDFPSIINNKNGKPVRVVQTGKQGRYLGKITIDTENLPGGTGVDWKYELIPVTDRFDEERFDTEMANYINLYKEKVDSVNNVIIGKSLYELDKTRLGGLANFTADVGYDFALQTVDSLRSIGMEIPDIDLAIMNVGGIRHHFPKGDITEGQILSTYPFSNKFVIISTKGENIIAAMNKAAKKGGEAISRNARVVYDDEGNLIRMIIDNKEIDPDKDYVIGTIDYVAEGNDDMDELANHVKLWESEEEISVHILDAIKRLTSLGLPVAPDCTPRFLKEINLNR